MRKVGFLFLFVGLSLLLTACSFKPIEYPFLQSQENIEEVVICTNDDQTELREELIKLSETEIPTFLSDLSALPCHNIFRSPPPLVYGDIVIIITYVNGEMEIIGLEQIKRFSSDGEELPGNYWFDHVDICKIIPKYVDPQVLSEVSGYF